MSATSDALRILAEGGHVTDERDLFAAAAHELEHQAADLADLRATLARRDGVHGLERQHDAAGHIHGNWHVHRSDACCQDHEQGGRA